VAMKGEGSCRPRVSGEPATNDSKGPLLDSRLRGNHWGELLALRKLSFPAPMQSLFQRFYLGEPFQGSARQPLS